MKPVLILKPQVHDDLTDNYLHIASDKFIPAERFLEVAIEAFARLAAMPSIGVKGDFEHPSLSAIRIYPLPPPYRAYNVIYQPVPGGVEIISVLHGSRDTEPALRRILKI